MKLKLATGEEVALSDLITRLRRKNRGGLPGWVTNDRADALEALDQLEAFVNRTARYLYVLRRETGTGTIFADPDLSQDELTTLIEQRAYDAMVDRGSALGLERVADVVGHTIHCVKRIAWGDGKCECRPNGESLQDENERLKKWVADLQSGTYITCVYCGHQYGPKDEVPTSMADVLKEHIKQCKHHPMAKEQDKSAGLRFHLRKAIRFLKTWPTSESSSELDEMGGPDSLYAFIRHVETRKLTEPDHE